MAKKTSAISKKYSYEGHLTFIIHDYIGEEGSSDENYITNRKNYQPNKNTKYLN